ncbi:DUF3267 domain-containing protein [Natrialbaceae archaeon A-arb3/5]
MRRTDQSTPARPVSTFQLTRRLSLQWLVVSVVGFFAFAYCFGYALAAVRRVAFEPIVIAVPPPSALAIWIAIAAVLVALTVFLHEALHGLAMSRYGGTPNYGVGLSNFVFPHAYAETSTSYARTQLLVVLLAPFVGISAIGFAAMVVYPTPLLLVVLAANGAGSVGDLWMAAALFQYRSNVRVAGLPDGAHGFAVYAPDGESVTRRPGSESLSALLAGSVGTLTLVVVSLLAAVLLSLAVGSGTVVIDGPTDRWHLFHHEQQASGRVLLEIGAPLVVVGMAVGGVAWTVLDAVRRRFA